MKRIVFVVLPLLVLAGCERSYRNVYVNHDAEACGVADPVHTLDWMRDLNVKNATMTVVRDAEFFEINVCVYENEETGDSYIAEFFSTWQSGVSVYDCDGNLKLGGAWENPHSEFVGKKPKWKNEDEMMEAVLEPCMECEEFFESHTLKDHVARYEHKPAD